MPNNLYLASDFVGNGCQRVRGSRTRWVQLSSRGDGHQGQSVDPWSVLVFDSTWYKWSTYTRNSEVWGLIYYKKPYSPRLEVWIYVGDGPTKVVGLPEAKVWIAKDDCLFWGFLWVEPIARQDFKSADTYNHAVHKICQKLKFCEKEPSDADKIEKTLSTASIRVTHHSAVPWEGFHSLRKFDTDFASGREKSWAHCLELTATTSGYCSPARSHVTQRTGRDGSSSHPRNYSGGKRKKFRKSRETSTTRR